MTEKMIERNEASNNELIYTKGILAQAQENFDSRIFQNDGAKKHKQVFYDDIILEVNYYICNNKLEGEYFWMVYLDI